MAETKENLVGEYFLVNPNIQKVLLPADWEEEDFDTPYECIHDADDYILLHIVYEGKSVKVQPFGWWLPRRSLDILEDFRDIENVEDLLDHWE